MALALWEANAREEAQNLLKELEVVNTQLSDYANKVEDLTLTAERQRMARELHDTRAQGLVGLILQLEAADSHLTSNNFEKTQGIIQQAMSRARTTLADARLAISDFREVDKSSANLEEKICSEIEKFTNTTGIPCDVVLGNLVEIPDEMAETIHRVISEGLMNIAKHARASESRVSVINSGNKVHLEIYDNGVGFSPEDSVGQFGHFGLLGIRERVRILGGESSIKSGPDSGSR